MVTGSEWMLDRTVWENSAHGVVGGSTDMMVSISTQNVLTLLLLSLWNEMDRNRIRCLTVP